MTFFSTLYEAEISQDSIFTTSLNLKSSMKFIILVTNPSLLERPFELRLYIDPEVIVRSEAYE